MARFFNPMETGRESSAGSGKTYTLKRVRSRCLIDSIDAMSRYGGEWCLTSLIEQNFAAVNNPYICLSNPVLSGFVVPIFSDNGLLVGALPAGMDFGVDVNTDYAGNVKAFSIIDEFICNLHVNDCVTIDGAIERDYNKRVKIYEKHIASLRKRLKTLDENDPGYADEKAIIEAAISSSVKPENNKNAANFLTEMLLSGEFVTIWHDGVRRNTCEVAVEIVNAYASHDLEKDMALSGGSSTNPMRWFFISRGGAGMYDFFFAVRPVDVEIELPGCSDYPRTEVFFKICYVAKSRNCSFRGTGLPRHVVIEGLTFPVVGGSTVKMSYAGIQSFPNAVEQAAYIDDATENAIDAWSMNSLPSFDGLHFALTTPAIAYMIVHDLPKACIAAESATRTPEFAAVIDNDGNELFSAGSAKSLYWALRKYSARFANSTLTIFANTNVTDDEVSVLDKFTIRNARFDLFKEWIVDPKGDVFIETLGQIWNRVTKTESTLKNGMSSGITRAFDAATGNAVWAVYVNRGDPANDPVGDGFMVGLESGETVYGFLNGHLDANIDSTHRITDRATSHVVLRKIPSTLSLGDSSLDFFVFIDTPQREKKRLAHIFLARADEGHSIPAVFVGTADAENIIEYHALAPKFLGKQVMPKEREEINVGEFERITAQIIDNHWRGTDYLLEAFDD